MAQRVIFTKPGDVRLEQFEPPDVGVGTIGVRTIYTLISTGTELTVLNGQYETGSNWARYAQFPFQPGYAAIGEVTQVGSAVTGFAPGDRVALRGPHASHQVVPALLCTHIPPGIDLKLAPWFALAKIALMGARAANHGLGDSVVIIGVGPIGQMSVRWASAAGARAVIALDSVQDRLAFARRGGATAVIAKSPLDAGDEVRGLVGPDGPDIIIDSTGNAEVISAALGLVRTRGRVVLLGIPRDPSRMHLTADIITRRITLVGAHDSDSESVPNWDGDRALFSLFFHLVATRRFDLEGLNTHTFEPKACEAAYRLANERRGDTLGIVFDWTKL